MKLTNAERNYINQAISAAKTGCHNVRCDYCPYFTEETIKGTYNCLLLLASARAMKIKAKENNK